MSEYARQINNALDKQSLYLSATIIALSTCGFYFSIFFGQPSDIGLYETLTLLLTTPSYWLVVVCTSISFIIFHHKKKQAVVGSLSTIEPIERWAHNLTVNGESLPLKNDSVIANAINLAQNKAAEASNDSSQFDQLLREKALIDPETKIGNRAFLNNRLEAVLKEEDIRGVVMLIQLQEGEVIQKLYGESSAHNVLMNHIEVIKHRLNHLANYYLARRNDFELAILLPGVYVNEAVKLSDRLLQNLNNIVLPVGVHSDEFIHLGLSFLNKDNTAYQIMAEADMALRSAQLQGPSQWFMFDKNEVIHDLAKGSLKWRTFLQAAIDKNSFVLFFQPVISHQDSQVLHHEVLAKVRDECGELISARVFLPMAKKCGLTVAIDKLIFEQVCRVLSYEKTEHESCSLNLSIESMLSADFRTYLLVRLQEQEKIAKQLIIEVTEYHLVAHLEELSAFLQDLHLSGVKLLVDKVGQYVENAQYLKSCPFSFVKLHRSIVLNLPEKPENQLFIQSLKTMCDYHNVEVYALGVEQAEEWRMLRQLGVNGGQGHYFTEPLKEVAQAIQLTH